jgi:hypothetical protein
MSIREYFEKQRKLRATSIRAYMTCLTKLNGNEEPTDLFFLRDYEKVFEYLKPLKLTTQRSYMIAVNQSLKSVNDWDELKDVYEDKLETLDYEYNKKIDTYQKSDTEEKNWVSLDELKLVADYWVDMIDEIQYDQRQYSKIFEVYKNAIVALLYTDHPAIRLDYATMEIIYDENDIEPKKNYLLIEGDCKNFILQHYKTSSKHNEKVWSPSDRLSKIIDEWIKINETKYLLPNRNFTNSLTTNALGKMITRVFESLDKKITVNTIRHIWITEKVDHKILDQNKSLASAMCHNPMTQRNYIKI